MNKYDKLKNRPVSVTIAILIIIVFILFNSQVFSEVPCGKGFYEVFMSQILHVDKIHLIYNLYSLYALSRVEKEMGSKSFIWLLVFLVLFNTLVSFMGRRFIPGFNCAIGFSGILFGLMTWEIIAYEKIDLSILVAIAFMIIYPSIQNKRVSFVGHTIGAFSGIIAALVWKTIYKESI